MMRKIKIVLLFIAVLAGKQSFSQVDMKDLHEVDGKMYTKTNTLYTGEFFDNGNSGTLKVKGTIKNGLPDGLIIGYFDNGKRSFELTMKDGKKNGTAKEYLENGNLKSEINIVNDLSEGQSLTYYETGQKHTEATFKNGVEVGDFIEYNKQGKIIHSVKIANGRVDYGKQINDLVSQADSLAHLYKSDEAIAFYTKAIDINPKIAELYFNRGATKSRKFDMDGAIADYDKAIELNPEYKEAYANRGVAKINHYTSKGTIELTAEQSKPGCDDLYKARDLGDDAAVEDMIYAHCEINKHQADSAAQADANNTDDKSKTFPLVFCDGKKIDQSTLNKTNPEDVLEITVIKDKSKTAKYGAEGKNGVLLITTINFGIQSYQKKFGALSADYAKTARTPDVFSYQIDGKLLSGKLSEIVGKLYNLKADTIKSVNLTHKTVDITTK
jgi:antitoxin component YwqK of YwqJK toxin-antitoxin module